MYVCMYVFRLEPFGSAKRPLVSMGDSLEGSEHGRILQRQQHRWESISHSKSPKYLYSRMLGFYIRNCHYDLEVTVPLTLWDT